MVSSPPRRGRRGCRRHGRAGSPSESNSPTRVVEFGVQKLSSLGVYCTVLKFSVLKGIERVEGSLPAFRVESLGSSRAPKGSRV